MWRACESIMQVIKDRTKNMGNKIIGYYEAVRIAYTESEYMQKYLDTTIKEVDCLVLLYFTSLSFTHILCCLLS
jgi:hypothetical protein